MSESKYYVFTLNNYSDSDIVQINDSVPSIVGYIAYGKEVAPGTGTPHLQGHLELYKKARITKLKKIPGFEKVHFQVRRGTWEESETYISKEDPSPFRKGDRQSKGKGCRSDLQSLHEDLKAGKRLSEISNDHFGSSLRYSRGISFWLAHNTEPRKWRSEVIVYWGKSGAGKTRAVHDNATDLYSHPGGPWFDGYEGQAQAIFDDFTGSCFKLGYLLKLLDRYPMKVPFKGGFVEWRPREIYITSNLNPNEWYAGANEEHRRALKRRFGLVIKF
jgi:hypothetical protein